MREVSEKRFNEFILQYHQPLEHKNQGWNGKNGRKWFIRDSDTLIAEIKIDQKIRTYFIQELLQ
ncbi:MAG: hypothetical protein ACXQTL_05530 [Methanosarcinales archaeon]